MSTGGGTGSQLVIRAREAAQRAKAASFMGVVKPVLTNETPFQGGPTSMLTPAQPPTAGMADRPVRDRMFSEAETFLSSLTRGIG